VLSVTAVGEAFNCTAPLPAARRARRYCADTRAPFRVQIFSAPGPPPRAYINGPRRPSPCCAPMGTIHGSRRTDTTQCRRPQSVCASSSPSTSQHSLQPSCRPESAARQENLEVDPSRQARASQVQITGEPITAWGRSRNFWVTFLGGLPIPLRATPRIAAVRRAVGNRPP
jgi:hypothetical protein